MGPIHKNTGIHTRIIARPHAQLQRERALGDRLVREPQRRPEPKRVRPVAPLTRACGSHQLLRVAAQILARHADRVLVNDRLSLPTHARRARAAAALASAGLRA